MTLEGQNRPRGILLLARQPPVGQGLLIHEVSSLHPNAPQSVGLLWMSDQLVAQRPLPDNTQTSMPPVGFEPTISAGERPQIHALDRAATGTGDHGHYLLTPWSRVLLEKLTSKLCS